MAGHLQKKGIRVVVYLDDFLIANQDRDLLCRQTEETVTFLEQLGWQVNRKKSVLEPRQQIEYLGICWDSSKQNNSVRKEKTEHSKGFEQCCNSSAMGLEHGQKCTGKDKFCLVRHSSWKTAFKEHAKSQFSASGKQTKIKTQSSEDCAYRKQMVDKKYRGMLETLPIQPKNIPDSRCKQLRLGGSNRKQTFQRCMVSRTKKLAHKLQRDVCNTCGSKEMRVKFKRGIYPYSIGQSHSSVIYNESGGMKSQKLLQMIGALLTLAERHRITLSAQYIPGIYNSVADSLSRNKPLPDWHLLPSLTNRIFRL